MSAETLRRAAALMRERAEAATPGPWESGERIVWSIADTRDPYVISDGEAGDGGAFSTTNAEHIASWHPAVALAVADWLDAEAADRTGSMFEPAISPNALAVARAYLGETA